MDANIHIHMLKILLFIFLIQKKSRKSLAFLDDEADNEHPSDASEEDDDTQTDSDGELPMFEHEDAPPDSGEQEEEKTELQNKKLSIY